MSGYDPDDLVRWAENYGHPEEWAKKAQSLHAKVEELRALRVGAVSVPLADRDRYRELCEMVDAHYSGSLDHQPAYVRAIRTALSEEAA